jgi:hypothetical protein
LTVKALEVEVGRVKPVASGAAAALTVGETRLWLYMRGSLTLMKYSKDRKSIETAVETLRALGVAAEVKGGGGAWHVVVSLGKLASAAPELKDAVATAIREAVKAGLVPETRARRWLERLESGRVAKWPGYSLDLTPKGALMVRYTTTNVGNLEREAERLRSAGLVEGLHFTVKMPEGDNAGYIYIRREGLRRIATMAARGNPVAAEFVEHILHRAKEVGGAVYERIRKTVEAGRAVGSLKLSEVKEVEVEVGGKKHVVTVLSWDAEWDGHHLRISILAEVDGVEEWHSATFYRRGGRVDGSAYAKASAPGGAETDAERFAALMKALTGREPKAYTVKGGFVFFLGRACLDALARYAELADIVEDWLIVSWFAENATESKRGLV